MNTLSKVSLWLAMGLAMISTACSSGLSEEEMNSKLDQILSARDDEGQFTDEQINKALKLIADHPEAFDYDFSEIWPMSVVTSSDDNVRAYTIDRYGYQGDNKYDFTTLIQYRLKDKIYSKQLDDYYDNIDDIYLLSVDFDYYEDIDTAFDQTAYYLILGHLNDDEYGQSSARIYTLSTKDGFENQDASFDDDYMLSVVYAQPGEEEVLSEYGFSDKYDDSTLDYLAIRYNPSNQELYVMNADELTPDGTFTIYSYDRFDGKFSNTTLSDPIEACNDDYYIRITQLSDGSCKYEVWNGGDKQGDADLTIYGGKRQVWIQHGQLVDYNKWTYTDDFTPRREQFSFSNGGYKYVFAMNYAETVADLTVYDAKGNKVYSGTFSDFL